MKWLDRATGWSLERARATLVSAENSFLHSLGTDVLEAQSTETATLHSKKKMADEPRQGHKYQFMRMEAFRDHEAWRPRFSRVLPGFLPALGLFAGYVVLEKIYTKVSSIILTQSLWTWRFDSVSHFLLLLSLPCVLTPMILSDSNLMHDFRCFFLFASMRC